MGHREHPDTRALGRIGCCVRERLARQSTLARLDSPDVELWHAEAYVEPHACARLIALIDTAAAPSLLAQEDGWAGYRTSCSADIPPADHDVRMLEQRLTDLTGIDARCGENLQGQRYAPGEYYHTHCDWFDTAAPYWQHERRCGGQRSWTAMVYLNDVNGGGETHFPRSACAFARAPARCWCGTTPAPTALRIPRPATPPSRWNKARNIS
ncbi:2OG-Fe(II) oxygenase [Novosphingobium sp. 9]|uniref:2OG-Fe(II) oxygenase n=1 Tax=Novosphingobium sp. 9 TaxID=2025349 RepID=UPI0021B5E46C|nr:2OG-Fe(II) oxygenase [Novosphingobium sp. 9]